MHKTLTDWLWLKYVQNILQPISFATLFKRIGLQARTVAYRINILGSQLSPSGINFVPASAGKATVGLGLA